MREADIITTIYFYKTEEGGIKNNLHSGECRCPTFIAGEYWDCIFRYDKEKIIHPGDSLTVKMWFLSSEIIMPLLKVGDKFNLWSQRIIADCVIDEIIAK